MKNSIKVSVIGGDLRALAVARKLALSYDNINIWGIDLGGVSEISGVEFRDELEDALKFAFSSGKTVVIDTIIDKDEFVLPMLPPGGSIDDIITKVER